MAVSTPQITRPRPWAIPIPWLCDRDGKTEYLRGHEPTWHAMIFFVGAASSTRVVLSLTAPTDPRAYVAAYGACMALGLIIGHLIRAKGDDLFSRLCSAGLGFIGFDATSALAALSLHPPTSAPAAAGIAPGVAGLIILLLSVTGKKLADWFPIPEPENVTHAAEGE